MTKQEYLLSLPTHRKQALLYAYYDYNKYFDDMENEYDEDDFESNLYGIVQIVNSHSSYLTKDEFEIFNNLESDYDY